MARRRSQRTRAQLLAELEVLRPLKSVAMAGIRYADEIYSPNIKEPFSIANRRTDLVERVRAYKARGARRAA